MATVEGWRIVRRQTAEHPEIDDYSSVNPEVEGDVVTPPNTSITDPVWVWSDFVELALNSIAMIPIPSDTYDHASSYPLLLVEYDDADILETVEMASRPAIEPNPAGPRFRYLVSACEIGDEVTYQEAAGLAVLAQPHPNHGKAGYLIAAGTTATNGGTYDAVDAAPTYDQSGRQASVAAGDGFPSLEGDEVGYMPRLRYPYSYLDILAAHGRTDPLA